MIRSAVESVLAQDHQPIEIIIVDDGSTDRTLEVCRALAAEHPKMITVLSQHNSGPGPAREKGRVHARGEFIQYLDSDDRLLPGKFTAQVEALRQHPDCDIAYGITRLVNAEGKVLEESFKWTGEQREYLFPGLLVDRWWCTHTPLYRRSLCDRIGPWSDLRYSQDWEYDARAGALRVKLAYVSFSVSEHREHRERRQTGGGAWLQPASQLTFFSNLYQCAEAAGVPHTASELKHLSRWIFSQSRKCEDSHVARDLLKLAGTVAGDTNMQIKAYDKVAKILGWGLTVKLERVVRKVSRREFGENTMKQSWMK
jgi:glycosyltransferase involved in cell wall biosynthesis